jgi:hypothetical protein
MSVENSVENNPPFRKTTEKFQEFKAYYEEENKRTGEWDSDENFLARYIVKYKLSPFVGDDNLQEARKFLKECGINKEIL